MAASSAVQAVLYLSRFGVSERTDAFFAAFALYTVFGIFIQSIRVTAVPMLVGERRMPRREFAGTLALIAVAVVAAGRRSSSRAAQRRAGSARGLDPRHTGQHYDEAMSGRRCSSSSRPV